MFGKAVSSLPHVTVVGAVIISRLLAGGQAGAKVAVAGALKMGGGIPNWCNVFLWSSVSCPWCSHVSMQVCIQTSRLTYSIVKEGCDGWAAP